MKTKVLLFSIVLLGAAAAMTVMYLGKDPAMEHRRPDYTLSAKNLSEAFAIDETGANERYGGKVVQVNGRLRQVMKDGHTLILQLDGGGGANGVRCYLSDDPDGKAARLTPGQTVSVRGICNGALLDVVLDRCVLIHWEKSQG